MFVYFDVYSEPVLFALYLCGILSMIFPGEATRLLYNADTINKVFKHFIVYCSLTMSLYCNYVSVFERGEKNILRIVNKFAALRR